MNTCPHHKLRDGLPPLTDRLKRLPIDERGYPVPFFVAWIDGKPEFRMADPRKQQRCIQNSLCWVCGQLLAEPELAFIIGPMCGINRISSEPPAHMECAEWSVRGCPFMAKPQMERREHEMIAAAGNIGGGVIIARNPGVMLIWGTYNFKIINAPNKEGGSGPLWQVGDPSSLSFWREGRAATRAEMIESIESGLPLLLNAGRTAQENAECEPEIRRQLAEFMKLLPAS